MRTVMTQRNVAVSETRRQHRGWQNRVRTGRRLRQWI